MKNKVQAPSTMNIKATNAKSLKAPLVATNTLIELLNDAQHELEHSNDS